MPEIENRPYGPDSSEQEIAAISRRISAVDDDIFIWHELPKQTAFSVQVMGQSLREQTQGLDAFYLIADLRDAGRPDAEVREAIRENMLSIPHKVHFSALVGGNVMLIMAAKFIISRFGVESWSVTKSMDDSLAEIEKIKKERSHCHG